jgi:hypothetical protein
MRGRRGRPYALESARLAFSITSLNSSASGMTSPIERVPGALSSLVKRAGHEADHSPQTSAEVKKT